MGLEWEFLSGPLRTIVFGAVVAPRRKTTSLTLYWALGGGFAKAPRLTPTFVADSTIQNVLCVPGCVGHAFAHAIAAPMLDVSFHCFCEQEQAQSANTSVR